MNTSLSTGSEAVFSLYCQPCNEEGKHLEAVGYCMDCEEHLCSTCFKCHLVPKPMRNHRLKDESEMPQQMKDKPSANLSTDLCPLHPDKVIEYFCKNHNQLGCSVCTTLHHRACDEIDYIPGVANEVGDSEELKDLRWRLEVLCNTVEKIKFVSKENKEAAEVYRKDVKAEIKRMTQAVTAIMTKLEEAMDRKVDSIVDLDLQLLNDSAQKSDAVAAEINDLTKDLEERKQNGENCQLFVAMKNSEVAVRELEKKTKSLASMNRIKRCHFTPNTKWQEMIAAPPDIGTVDVWRNSDMKATYVMDIDVNILDDAQGVIGGGVWVNEHCLAVCNIYLSAVELIDVEQNKTVSAVTLKSHPACITKVTDSQAIVTLPKESKLHFLSLTGDKLQDTDQNISVNGQCWDVLSTQHHLIVSFLESFKIEVYDLEGTVLRHFVYSAGNPVKEEMPFLSVSPCHDTIYVSSPKANKVVSLTLDGKFLDSYIDDRLKGPVAVVADLCGNVFVCGAESNNVHVLTSDLKKIKILLEGDGVNEPTFMYTNKSANKLYIYMAGSRKIKVYQVGM